MDSSITDHSSESNTQGVVSSHNDFDSLDKGKGKAPQHDAMDEDDEDDEEDDEEGEGDVEVEEADEDNMEEIDLDNIVGSRTRGKNIDYAEAAKQLSDDEDEDDEDDEDFEDEEMED